MAAKRRRKSQGGAPSAERAEGIEPEGTEAESTEGAEGTETAETAGSEVAAGEAGVEMQAASAESAADTSAVDTSGAEASGTEAVAARRSAPTPALTRSETDAPARSVRELGQHTAASYLQSRDAAADFVDTARERIREQPVQSLLIAAGVGVLIGIIWR